MSQVTVKLSDVLDKVVGVVKGVRGFRSKDEAIQFIIREKGKEILERELRPKFVKKILKLEKTGKFTKYGSMKQFEDELNA